MTKVNFQHQAKARYIRAFDTSYLCCHNHVLRESIVAFSASATSLEIPMYSIKQ